jgi:hypothetical protein
MVVASLPGVGIQQAKAAEHPTIHVWLSGEAMIEFFNFDFTDEELIDVSVVGVGSIGAVVAESERFVAEFDFEFDGNQTVVASQGSLAAEVTLADMSIDFDGVNVFGTGPELTTLGVEVVGSDCPFGDDSSKEVATNASGEWATDFAVECPLGLGEEFQGSVFHFDDEGNATIVENANERFDEEWVALVDTSQGMWHLRHNPDDVTTFFYGNPGDIPFMGDWDCDGVATPGLFRQSDAFAYLRNTNSQGIADIRFFFGNPSDIPLAGDFNGDGCDTLSIYRPSEARFYIVNALGTNDGGLGPADYSFLFGNLGDKPVVGDWDGDGIDEIGLHRETTGLFYWRNTLDTGIADGTIFFGDPGDRFVAGDWGIVDGRDTPAVFRPSNTTFYFRHTLTEGNADSQLVFGQPGWIPVAGDFGFG